MNVYPLALYIVAFVAYLWHFARRQPAVGRAATTLLVAAALTHTFVVGMQTMEAGHVPVTNASSAISTVVWLLALAYLYTEMTTDERAMGTFILPLLIGLQILPVLQPGVEDRAPVLQGPLFGLHVLSLLSAYASFALACVIGVTYVLLFKEIKAKHLGFFYARLPSLQVLDTMNQRTIVFGWICLTIGIVVGTIWAGQAQAYAPEDVRGPGDVAAGSEDLRRAGLLGGVFLRGLRGAADGLGRQADGLSLRPGVRHRAAQLRADLVFPDDEPQLLGQNGTFSVPLL